MRYHGNIQLRIDTCLKISAETGLGCDLHLSSLQRSKFSPTAVRLRYVVNRVEVGVSFRLFSISFLQELQQTGLWF